jgi:rare lipoprotein A
VKIILSILLLILLTACSSVPRFTKESERAGTGHFPSSTVLTGTASYYADEYHGRKTSNGEIYDMYKLTAAHRDLPFNTKVRVTNLKNQKTVTVRINDRMPDFKNRIIDLSYGAAKQLDMIQDGIVEVKMEILRLGN